MATLLGFSPGDTPADVTTDPICSPLPPEPLRIGALPFASTAADGARTWGAEATYELSSGDVGEAFMVLDELGAGEVQLMINGEIVAHVAMAASSSGEGPVLTTWMPATVNYPPELVAEMLRVDLPLVVAESLPQEFKCSGWAKKMLNAGKYLWAGAVTAGAAACCVATGVITPGCIICAGVVGAGGAYIGDKIGNHCD